MKYVDIHRVEISAIKAHCWTHTLCLLITYCRQIKLNYCMIIKNFSFPQFKYLLLFGLRLSELTFHVAASIFLHFFFKKSKTEDAEHERKESAKLLEWSVSMSEKTKQKLWEEFKTPEGLWNLFHAAVDCPSLLPDFYNQFTSKWKTKLQFHYVRKRPMGRFLT